MDSLASTNPAGTNGQSAVHDLFALTDEQILEIEPEASDVIDVGQPFLAVQAQSEEIVQAKTSPDPSRGVTPESAAQAIQQNAQAGMPVPPEPPPWLAAQMKDPWSGEEARDLWNAVQQARQEAAAYRAAIATPEDARAFKELYPGGVNEARGAAEHARLLEEIDRAYFGAPGGSAEQASASRAQLAHRMLREDPAAFREMVIAGLRALEEAEKGSGASANAANLPRLAQVFTPSRSETRPSVGATLGSPDARGGTAQMGGASPAPTTTADDRQHESPVSSHESHLAAYAAFEKAANEDLERSVGAAIARTIEQALPNPSKTDRAPLVGAQHAAPLQARLSAAIRQDVEAALKGDRQLGEQIAQILSARRFDNETRAQVVRLIDERARQLVPGAAKRVLNEWTHTTLAAHRGNSARANATSASTEVPPANTEAGRASLPASPSQRRLISQSPDTRRIDYRKLSDEQILDL